jgi:predicted Zn-dependent peptidase
MPPCTFFGNPARKEDGESSLLEKMAFNSNSTRKAEKENETAIKHQKEEGVARLSVTSVLRDPSDLSSVMPPGH